MRAVSPRLDGGVRIQSEGGTVVEARLIQSSRDAVVFEAYIPEALFKTGEVVQNIALLRGNSIVCSGPAKVTGLLVTGSSVIVTVAAVGSWLSDGISPVAALQDHANDLIRRWRDGQRVQPGYQVAVGNIRSFLTQLSEWCAPIDLALETGDAAMREERSNQLSQAIFSIVQPQLKEIFDAYESAATFVPGEVNDAHRAFAQRELHPLLLCAPLFHRGLTKPLGYAGDYEMVNMLLRNAMEGQTVYAKVVNAHFLQMDISEGHRNRIEKLVDILQAEVRRVAVEGRSLRVLNIGCGPVDEIRRFIRRDPLSARCEFALIDFNAQTLAYAREQVEQAIQESGNRPVVRYVQRSVNDLLKDAARHGRLEGFAEQDLIYCAGLFDYLSDKVCARLLGCFLHTAAEDGAVVATNVHPRHTSRATLADLGEWPLILRTETELGMLAPQGASNLSVTTEAARTNVFLEFRRSSAFSSDVSERSKRLDLRVDGRVSAV